MLWSHALSMLWSFRATVVRLDKIYRMMSRIQFKLKRNSRAQLRFCSKYRNVEVLQSMSSLTTVAIKDLIYEWNMRALEN